MYIKKIIYFLLFLPLIFFGQEKENSIKYIQNNGQWNDSILFKANIPEGHIFLENHKFTYSFMDCEKVD